MSKQIDRRDIHKKFRKELSAGTAALVLLSLLAQSEEALYGYQIGKLVGAGEEEPELIKQGAIYPVLRSLESSGLLSSYREASKSGPPRRYYQVTEEGKQVLEEWKAIWQEIKEFVDHRLKGKKE
mgnify:CR=1 FL=1